MIVRQQGDEIVLIRQTDHAVLSGFFAREWGNDLFSRPEPFDSFCLATSEHDSGWREWELEPRIDPKSSLPYSFMSLPTVDHIRLYQRCIDRLAKLDPYAELLVNMHCIGLYDRARATLPGFSAKYVKSDESGLVNDFVQRLRLRQLRVKVDLRANASTKDAAGENQLQMNYRRMEALDRLSLLFCLNAFEGATIDRVAVDNEGSEADLELHLDGNSVVSLAPYPFRRSPLKVSVLARSVPRRLYVDDLDFQKALARAPYFALNFTLLARTTSTHSRTAVA
jgi:hypothetical protein